jgi:sporulation-control protein spo0M
MLLLSYIDPLLQTMEHAGIELKYALCETTPNFLKNPNTPAGNP